MAMDKSLEAFRLDVIEVEIKEGLELLGERESLLAALLSHVNRWFGLEPAPPVLAGDRPRDIDIDVILVSSFNGI